MENLAIQRERAWVCYYVFKYSVFFLKFLCSVKVERPRTPKTGSSRSAGAGGRRIPGAASIPSPPSPPGGSRNKANENRSELRKEAQDAINFILPPKEWNEDGQTWRQLVPTVYLNPSQLI